MGRGGSSAIGRAFVFVRCVKSDESARTGEKRSNEDGRIVTVETDAPFPIAAVAMKPQRQLTELSERTPYSRRYKY